MANMTKAEKLHMNKVADIGCILDICRMPAELHHIRTGQGMAKRASSFEVIPLCPKHHRTGGHGIAIHAGVKTFEKKYGTQEELLTKTMELIK